MNTPFRDVILVVAATPFIYYLLVLYSTFRFFKSEGQTGGDFTPPISILKPVRGLDPGAYNNFASYCRQNYPASYEILFCVDRDDPAATVIEKLRDDFPHRAIRIFYGPGRQATNDKVARLSRLVEEARYEHVIASDSDVFAEPDYLRSLVAPLKNPSVGAVTCPYILSTAQNFTQSLQSIGMISDFYPGIFVARELDGIKFAHGPTIATTKACLAAFGGYPAIADRPADDLHVGRYITQQGREVILLPYALHTVPDFDSFGGFLNKRLRWMTSMHHLRPWGHLGLIFTFGLPWSLLAIATHPTPLTTLTYAGCYVVFRVATAWFVGSWGFKQRRTRKEIVLIPLWDLQAFLIWLFSFFRKTIVWRGFVYRFEAGRFFRASTNVAGEQYGGVTVSASTGRNSR